VGTVGPTSRCRDTDLPYTPSSRVLCQQLAVAGRRGRHGQLVDHRAADCLDDPTLSSTYNDGFTNQTRTHAGSAANGYVTAEEWVRNNTNPLLSDVPPTQARPCGRFHLNYKVRRVQIDRVQLIDANTGSVLASSSGPKNSNGARTVLLCAANVFDLTTANLTVDPPTGAVCYNSVDAQIRWDDGSLSVVHYGSTVILNAWVIWGGPPA
jgi:hypothetical protein